ncbi:pilus assembly protein [Marinobacter sp. 1Y8]
MKTQQKLTALVNRPGRFFHGLFAFAIALMPVQFAQAEVSQAPLFLGGGSVPGNLVLTPSVEYPTIQSLANIENYSRLTRFEGYFDPDKCYVYSSKNVSGNESVYTDTKDYYFKPATAPDTSRDCTGNAQWSGNFLNWAATQTIDPFRKVLTGGDRVVDTATETWLEKARHPGQSGLSNQVLSGSVEVAAATPFSANKITVKIAGLGVDMRFALNDQGVDKNVERFDPSNWNKPQTKKGEKRSYQASVRVEVCDSSWPESNCKEYSQGWKPEGLIQQNARTIRYSVFGYLNDGSNSRDGGVLRAGQKYVGPEMLQEGDGFVDNPNKEWNPTTGVLVKNPNPADASSTPGNVVKSGVINYLNEFGQLNENNQKALDPVSELYYAATRYLKNQGNVSSYSANPSTKAVDDFPVISSWSDPVAYECQPNVILGIGDVNTHDDNNLPGATYRGDEPALPAAVSADSTINVTTATNKVGSLEGLGNGLGGSQFTGRQNSAHIAGLAYDNHTVDMRPDLAGKQTASTHWVDVLENQSLSSKSNNQYYLAAKYGGFDVPDEYDAYAQTTALPEALWSDGDTVSWGGTSFTRPRNFYIAGKASLMIDSLRAAFSNISAELSSSAASVAASSTSLETDTAVFQASFDSTHWSGDVLSYGIETDGTIDENYSWSAAAKLDAVTNVSTRNILTSQPLSSNGTVANELLSSTANNFTWNELSSDQQDVLRQTSSNGTLVTVSRGQERLGFLRGNRSLEITSADQSQPFRQRNSRLGDIINSNPQYVFKEDYGYQSLSKLTAYASIDEYSDFRTTTDYGNRIPVVLVGANDGMLHAFDAQTAGATAGSELFSYVPASIYSNLWKLTSPDYEHQYYVDGTPRVADAWLGSTLKWRTMAVGTTGAGGKSVFALDVTNPTAMTSSNFLWEFSHPDMGYTIGQPSVVPLQNGKFGVVVTSGYDSAATNGHVWVLDAATGRPIRTFELTGSGDLGAPLVVDLDHNRTADRIYVGDTEGKLWRLDIEGGLTSAWGVPDGLKDGTTPKPLFRTGTSQPITAQLTSAFDEKGQHMVFFGTGSFFRVGENVLQETPPIQSFYGIIDGGEPITRSDLLGQSILAEGTVGDQRYRVVSDNKLTAYNDGWYLDLAVPNEDGDLQQQGERVVSRALVRGDRVIFSTLIPSEDPCSAGGDSWLMEVNTFTGSRLDYSVFDVNGDSLFGAGDMVTIIVDGKEVKVPTSGFGSSVGIFGTATIVKGIGGSSSTGEGSNEIKVVSGSSGKMITIPEAGSVNVGRESWQQYR